jgi:hypothetical protein
MTSFDFWKAAAMSDNSPLVISVPEPRSLELIFSRDNEAMLRRDYRILEGQGVKVTDVVADHIGEASFYNRAARFAAPNFTASQSAQGSLQWRNFPQEPMPPDHPVRSLVDFVLSANRAGALDAAFKQMGKMVLENMELMTRGLPPVTCRRAERETVGLIRSKPVSRN